METLYRLFRTAVRPWEEFPRLAADGPLLGNSLVRLLLWRVPVAWLAWGIGLFQYRAFREGLLEGRLPFAGFAVDPEMLRAMGEALPGLPGLSILVPTVLLGAPLGVLSLWLHDAVWDHGALWLLGCRKILFRTTSVAVSEALRVGVLGALLALLGNLPYLGLVLGLPLMAVGGWFWVLRGFALAAWHGLPRWKGVVATLLHAVLAVLFFLLFLVLAWMLAVQMAV